MMEKIVKWVWVGVLAMLPLSGYGQAEPDFETGVTLIVSDDRGVPIEGAEVVLGFMHTWKIKDRSVRGTTGASGRFKTSGKVVDSLSLSVIKEGYYSVAKRRALIRMEVDEREIKDATFPLVMRKRISPIGLRAKRASIPAPSFEKWHGFDLESGEWKAENEVCDFQVRFTRTFHGLKRSRHPKSELLERLKKAHNPRGSGEGRYRNLVKFYEQDRSYSDDELIQHSLGKWHGKLEIKFPGKEEGIVVVDRDYVPYCELKMPHQAYEKGYAPAQVWTKENWGMAEPQSEKGYFLRTRVKLDEAGKIVSANYAKIIEEIKIDPRGRIEFAYVFNPTPNERNLEFDPSKNLFGKLSMDEEVRTP